MRIPKIILEHSTIHDEKMWHFYLIVVVWATTYGALATSLVVFLVDSLGSMFWAGIALAMGCCVSIFFDLPFNYLQKTISNKNLFLFSTAGLMLSVAVFLFGLTNIIFVFLAAIMISVMWDLFEITSTSYLLAKSLPANYAENLSTKEIAKSIGVAGGLVLSSILLLTSRVAGQVTESTANLVGLESGVLTTTKFIQLGLVLTLFFTLIFIMAFFEKTGTFKEGIMHSLQNLIPGSEHKEITLVNAQDYEAAKNGQHGEVLALQSTDNKQKFSLKDIFLELKKSFGELIDVFRGNPQIPLIWSIVIITIFSFWDTFISTFQPNFMQLVMDNQEGWLKSVPGNLILILVAIPLFIALPLFAKLVDKGKGFGLMVIGTTITGLACALFGFWAGTSLAKLILIGLCLSIGYACIMAAGKTSFTLKYNEYLIQRYRTTTIDTNESAGPLSVLYNIGNIIGPIIGAGIIGAFSIEDNKLPGYQMFYLLFGSMIIIIAIITIIFYRQFRGDEITTTDTKKPTILSHEPTDSPSATPPPTTTISNSSISQQI